jgi:hypothetical protein
VKVKGIVDWSGWDLLPVVNITRDADDFCAESPVWSLFLAWGPFGVWFSTGGKDVCSCPVDA